MLNIFIQCNNLTCIEYNIPAMPMILNNKELTRYGALVDNTVSWFAKDIFDKITTLTYNMSCPPQRRHICPIHHNADI